MPASPGEIVGLAADQTTREAHQRALHGADLRLLDLLDERAFERHAALARQLDEAAGEVDIIGGERCLDLPGGGRRVERARDRTVGERHRIVLGRDQRPGFEAARCKGDGGDRRSNRQSKRNCNPRSGHQPPLPSGAGARPPNVVGYDPAGKVPGWKIRRFLIRRISATPKRLLKNNGFSYNWNGWLRDFCTAMTSAAETSGSGHEGHGWVWCAGLVSARSPACLLQAWRPLPDRAPD